MKASFEPPKLSFWPFVCADLALLAVAAWLGQTAGPSPAAGLVWAAVTCVGLGGVLLCVPVVVNFTRKQELALAERQREIAALATTTAASAEQIGIAVAGISQLADALHRASKQAEHLPQRLQEKVNEFKAQLNEVAVNENEALAQELNALRTGETERLEAVIDRIQKMVTEWSALEAQARQHWTASFQQAQREVATSLERMPRELADAEGRFARLLAGVRPAPAQPPVVAEIRAADPAPTPTVIREEPPADPSSGPTPIAPTVEPRREREPIAPGRARTARRSSHDLLQGDLGFEEAAPDQDFESVSPSSLSADGRTRVVATAYIGIGNKLFVRGEGPGLSLERGVPLQFVSIGKWRWETDEAVSPVTLSFWKNDTERAHNVNSVVVPPSHLQEVRLTF